MRSREEPVTMMDPDPSACRAHLIESPSNTVLTVIVHPRDSLNGIRVSVHELATDFRSQDGLDRHGEDLDNCKYEHI